MPVAFAEAVRLRREAQLAADGRVEVEARVAHVVAERELDGGAQLQRPRAAARARGRARSASGDGATACAGNATTSSDARGTCTLPVTVTAGSSTSMVEIGCRENLGVGALHDAHGVAAQREARGPARVGIERRRARERQHAVAGMSRGVDLAARGRRCSLRWLRSRRRRAPSAARRCGRSTTPRGRRRSARRRCLQRRGRRRSAPATSLELGRQQREEARGRATRRADRRGSSSRARARRRSPRAIRRCRRLVLRTAAASSSRPSVSVMPACTLASSSVAKACSSPNSDARARRPAGQRERAARLAHEIEQRARELVDAARAAPSAAATAAASPSRSSGPRRRGDPRVGLAGRAPCTSARSRRAAGSYWRASRIRGPALPPSAPRAATVPEPLPRCRRGPQRRATRPRRTRPLRRSSSSSRRPPRRCAAVCAAVVPSIAARMSATRNRLARGTVRAFDRQRDACSGREPELAVRVETLQRRACERQVAQADAPAPVRLLPRAAEREIGASVLRRRPARAGRAARARRRRRARGSRGRARPSARRSWLRTRGAARRAARCRGSGNAAAPRNVTRIAAQAAAQIDRVERGIRFAVASAARSCRRTVEPARTKRRRAKRGSKPFAATARSAVRFAKLTVPAPRNVPPPCGVSASRARVARSQARAARRCPRR